MIEIPMTASQFAAAKTRLAASGVDLSGTAGTLSRQGVTAAWQWAEDKLTIDITDNPMFVPASMIETKLKEYIQNAISGKD